MNARTATGARKAIWRPLRLGAIAAATVLAVWGLWTNYPRKLLPIVGATRIVADDEFRTFIETEDPSTVASLSEVANEFLDQWVLARRPQEPLRIQFFDGPNELGMLGVGQDFFRRPELFGRVRFVPPSGSGAAVASTV